MKTLGEKIAGLRQEKNMTQQAFADVMGVTRQAISNWERNKTEPDVAALKKIGQIFGVDMNDLLTDIHLERQMCIRDRISAAGSQSGPASMLSTWKLTV